MGYFKYKDCEECKKAKYRNKCLCSQRSYWGNTDKPRGRFCSMMCFRMVYYPQHKEAISRYNKWRYKIGGSKKLRTEYRHNRENLVLKNHKLIRINGFADIQLSDEMRATLLQSSDNWYVELLKKYEPINKCLRSVKIIPNPMPYELGQGRKYKRYVVAEPIAMKVRA